MAIPKVALASAARIGLWREGSATAVTNGQLVAHPIFPGFGLGLPDGANR